MEKSDEDELVRHILLNQYGEDDLQKIGKDYKNIEEICTHISTLWKLKLDIVGDALGG